jgi:hypothetical protein
VNRAPVASVALVCAAAAAVGCAHPPASQFPTAGAALERMHATYACSRAVRGDAKIDYFDDNGRVRGSVLYLGMLPDSLRFDVYSPFGVMLSTLTSDGKQFSLFDLREKQFLHGPADTCNVSRFTRVPVPPFALVQLLRGEAPVLVHDPRATRIEWSSGRYVLTIPSKHAALEEIHIQPLEADYALPWQKQRVRVTEVRVEQHGMDLYVAELKDHRAGRTAQALVDEEGLTAPIPPSGPSCAAEIPHRLRISVSDTDQDLVLASEEVAHNPPVAPGDFSQKPPGGVRVRYAACGR